MLRRWALPALLASMLVALSSLPARAADVARPAPSASLSPALAAITQHRLFKQAKVGLHVVDVRTGEEVFAWGADTPLNPASTMKVVTSAAALRQLGPSFRFTTDIWTDGSVDASGTLKGNLYVEGHGDPTMVVERMWKWVGELKLEGIERIEGSVIVDDDAHERQPALPGWNKKADIENGPAYYSTLSALSVNYNTAAIAVGPGAEVGKPAKVRLETPVGDAVKLVNEVKTGSTSARRSLHIERSVDASGATTFTVQGTVPLRGDHERYYRTVADPTQQYIGALRELMRQHGIAVTGGFRRGDTPSAATRVMEVRSPPLAAVLMDMNKLSNNFIAEQVLRALGEEVHGEGTTESGLRAVSDYLRGLGVEVESLNLVNGSGLSRDATLPPSVLTAVLVDMAHDAKVGQEFSATLAIAGYDGTLWSRLRDDAGRLRGKTGTIDGVHCLAGYLDDARGARYAFAFMVNDHGSQISAVRELHDRFARTMFKWGSDDADER